jgi:hypothetical protein
MLSAMVLEKAPESECDGMVANSTAFARLLRCTEYRLLSRKASTCAPGSAARVVISRCPWVLHAQGRKGDLCLQRLEKGQVFSAGGPAYA